jgi:hypothetical protein
VSGTTPVRDQDDSSLRRLPKSLLSRNIPIPLIVCQQFIGFSGAPCADHLGVLDGIQRDVDDLAEKILI